VGELLDSTAWQNLLPFSSPVMGYTDGRYAWPPEAWQQFQRRGAIGISITGDERQPVHDCEFGAESPWTSATAAANRVQSRLWVVLYSSQANLPNVTAALKSKSLFWTDASYWPKPAVYLHIADPSGNIAGGRWQPPVTPIAIQNQWLSGMDVSVTYGSYPLEVAPDPPTPPKPPKPKRGRRMYVAVGSDAPLKGDVYLIGEGGQSPWKLGLTEAADQSAWLTGCGQASAIPLSSVFLSRIFGQ
jgi:hypothetical protein